MVKQGAANSPVGEFFADAHAILSDRQYLEWVSR
jgi:hypothetical protein